MCRDDCGEIIPAAEYGHTLRLSFAHAQATLAGTVRDSSGAVLPGAMPPRFARFNVTFRF
jgi:hypothetical protein